MMFMVIERFKQSEAVPVGERFRTHGRMLPEGVTYHASWMDSSGAQCFQLMEAVDAALLKTWTSKWDDLVEFEVVPVVTSAEFWAAKAAR